MSSAHAPALPGVDGQAQISESGISQTDAADVRSVRLRRSNRDGAADPAWKVGLFKLTLGSDGHFAGDTTAQTGIAYRIRAGLLAQTGPACGLPMKLVGACQASPWAERAAPRIDYRLDVRPLTTSTGLKLAGDLDR